jgi:hypothetical protein
MKMPATVNEQVVDSVTTDNVKTVAGAGAWAAAQMQIAHVTHSKRLDLIAEKMLADFVNSPGLGQMDSGQLGQKAANTTPPETGLDITSLAAQVAAALALLQAQSNGPAPVPAKA